MKRSRRVILDKALKDFADYNLPRDIIYVSYRDIVADPITPIQVKKSFKNWNALLRALEIVAPTASQPVEVANPKTISPLEMLRQASIEKIEDQEEDNEQDF